MFRVIQRPSNPEYSIGVCGALAGAGVHFCFWLVLQVCRALRSVEEAHLSPRRSPCKHNPELSFATGPRHFFLLFLLLLSARRREDKPEHRGHEARPWSRSASLQVTAAPQPTSRSNIDPPRWLIGLGAKGTLKVNDF